MPGKEILAIVIGGIINLFGIIIAGFLEYYKGFPWGMVLGSVFAIIGTLTTLIILYGEIISTWLPF